MTSLGSDYFYGAYIKFVLNNSGGGSEVVPATAQTGDWLGIVLISLFIMALVGAGIFAFVKRNSLVGIAKSISAKSGSVASVISNHRVVVGAVLAIGILLIAGITISSKAFAESNEYARPAAPPYQTAIASIDENTQCVSIPSVAIKDNYQPQGSSAPGDFWAEIKTFSIKPINGWKASDLGTWTVYIDGERVYEGSASASFDWEYVCREKGQCNIDISVSGIDSSLYQALNDQLVVSVEFRVSSVYTEPISENFKATVNLKNVDGTKEFTPNNLTSFNAYICNDRKWTDQGSGRYEKEFPAYTTYEDILSDWQYALDQKMFTEDSSLDFNKWQAANSSPYSVLLIRDNDFFPSWYPALKQVNFEYTIDANVELSAYGAQFVAEHGWTFDHVTELGGTEPNSIIKGTYSNRANVDELNSIFNSEFFVMGNYILSGWQKKGQMIYEASPEGAPLNNKAELDPVLVTISGSVIDESLKPVPNITVTFQPRGYKIKKVKVSNDIDKRMWSTTTDSNGNYLFSCPKGETGFFRFGGYYHTTTEQGLVGESIVVENLEKQVLATIVLKQKVTIKVTKEIHEPTNSRKLDNGMVKFITTDDAGNQKVFFGEEWDDKDRRVNIEVFTGISGKIVYESALYYGEYVVEDTSKVVEDTITLHIYPKTSDKADCYVYGRVVLLDGTGGYNPLTNVEVTLHLKDSDTDKEAYVTITTNENGYYTIDLFQNVYILDVSYIDPSMEEYVMRYSASMLFGDSYEFNITLYKAETSEDEFDQDA